MASEITAVTGITVNKGNISFTRAVNQSIDMSGTHFSWQVQNIATTQEQLVIAADVATNGVAWFRNLDLTNYVEIGLYISSVFYPLLRLKPGETARARLSPGVAVYAQAHTLAVDLEHIVVED